MKRHDYLKRALQAGLANNLSWIFSAFCVTKEKSDAYLENTYFLRIISFNPAYRFINKDGTLETIDDSLTKEPLFHFKERIKVDSSWMPNIKESFETCIGNLIFNAVIILPNFGPKYPFDNGKLSVQNHEKYIASRLIDTPKSGEIRDNAKIYVDEYLKFRDSLVYLEQFAPITNWSATRKGITKSPELAAYRTQLLNEYGSNLNDPTVFAEYENKLKAFDREWLKDDQAFGTFYKGKVLDVSRKKMFLAIGIPERLDPKDPIVPITRTLEEGQPTDPVEYTASLNGARFGSYSRGTETINGGVVSKSVIRIGSNYSIDMEDCGTTLGLKKVYTKDTIGMLVGRTIIEKTEMKLIEKIEDANHYLDQSVIIRSPAYCQAGPGDRLCRMCSGRALSQYKEGLVIPLTEVSHLILNQSLKAMHGKVLSTAEVDLRSVLT